MHDQREARELTEDLRATLSGAAGLPYLAAEPPLGAKADPGRQVRRRLGLAE